jgi:Flp pilus assembly protein TadD
MRDRAEDGAPRFALAACCGRLAGFLGPGLVVVYVAIATPPLVHGEQSSLAAASELLLKGRYAEAAERLTPLADEEPAAAIQLARCRTAQGQSDEAEHVLKAAAERFPSAARIRAELAMLALARGEHVTAASHKDAALALDKNCLPARWVAAELLRLSGKIAEAQEGYGWFIHAFANTPRLEYPADIVWLSQAVAQYAHWTHQSHLYRRLVSNILPAALAQNANYWPAHLALARLYLQKFNEADASAEISRGLAINPQAAELHAARAELALARFDLVTARAAIDRAIEINPELIRAWQLRADCFLADLKFAEAEIALQRAVQLNPHDEQTLGRLLAVYRATERPGRQSPPATRLIAEATERNPRCGELFLAAADSFDLMRRYPSAAEHYRLAELHLPQLSEARAGRGLILMRLGEEAEGGKLLAEALALDPFHVRVKNMLEVLDVLRGYAAIETEHFVIKFDRGQDELLARYAARYLEDEAFPDLTKRLSFVPPGKTLIEIFSRSGGTSGHGWFSARMVGLPFIGTVGACAGQMIALTSPTELEKKFDWASVLRHELVHVLNLQQTDFAVPHWLTEGLAVHLELQPRPKKWLELLARRHQAGELFNLDTLTLGFIRPASSDDWTLAYCQAELYVSYMLGTYGDDATGKLLAAYGERLSTPAAIDRCFGTSQAEFEAGYRRFVDKTIAAAENRLPAEKPSLAALQRSAETDPLNATAAARLAAAWLDRDNKAQARHWAEAAMKLQPKQPLASYVLARLQLASGDTAKATSLLEAALDPTQPNEELIALLANLRLQAGETAAAEQLYRLGDRQFPASDRWLKGLMRIALQAGDNDKLRPLLGRWVAAEPDNLAAQKKLAELSLASGDSETAQRAASKAIHLDIDDAAAHRLLGIAQQQRGQATDAKAELELAIRLDPQQQDAYAALAELHLAEGKLDDARLVLGRLRELAPQHPKVAELQKKIEP